MASVCAPSCSRDGFARDLGLEVAELLAVSAGLLDKVPLDRIAKLQAGLGPSLQSGHGQVVERICPNRLALGRGPARTAGRDQGFRAAMTGQLQGLETRTEGVRQLGAVVGAMRGVAAARLQQARSVMEGIGPIPGWIDSALADAMALLPDMRQPIPTAGGRLAVVLFTAEHGFVGNLAERVLQAAEADREAGSLVFGLGSRGVGLARARAWSFAWDSPLPAQVGAVSEVAHRVAQRLYGVFTTGAATRVDVVFPRAGVSGEVIVERRRLLPPDLARFRRSRPAAPMSYIDPARLLELLVGEYFFAELAHAAAEAFAAENAARLATMQRAHANISQRLEILAGEERHVRQEAITAELLDLMAGTLVAQHASSHGPARHLV